MLSTNIFSKAIGSYIFKTVTWWGSMSLIFFWALRPKPPGFPLYLAGARMPLLSLTYHKLKKSISPQNGFKISLHEIVNVPPRPLYYFTLTLYLSTKNSFKMA